jgi:hypothetical protein
VAGDIELKPRQGELKLDRVTNDQLIGLITREDDHRTREALRHELEAFIAELSGPSPSALERSLAGVAGTCWMAMRVYEAMDLGALKQNRTIAQAEHHQRRLDRAHRRYLATLKTLATVRKMGLPSVQVNIAKNQVNVSGGA